MSDEQTVARNDDIPPDDIIVGGIRELVATLNKSASEGDNDRRPPRSAMTAEFSWTIRLDGSNHWYIDEDNAGGTVTWGPVPSRASALHVVAQRRKLTESLMAVVLDALLGRAQPLT